MNDTLKDEIIALTMEAVEKAYQMGLIAGARAEREACAGLVEDWDSDGPDPRDIATAIRARGEI